MAYAGADKVTTTGTGASDHIGPLPEGNHTLMVTSATWGDADIQVGDGVTFVDAKYPDLTVVNLTANDAVIVPGGMCYRLDVTTHSAAITMVARKASK